MTPLDLVLIHPNSRAGNYPGLSELAAVETPVWAAMLASYVRLKGHSVAIIDAEAEQLSPAAVAARVAALGPLLACVVVYGHHPSASTQVMPAAGETVRAIRLGSRAILTMLLGGHVAALPERTLREEEADLICNGEGPVALSRCLEAIKAGRDVRGISPATPLVEYLDGEMPEPAWDLLPMHLYRAHNWHCLGGLARAPYASLYTTLGCPFSCSFCCIQSPFRDDRFSHAAALPDGKIRLDLYKPNVYRRWSPARIGETLEGLARRGIRNIKIADEMFVLNRAHVEGVCDEILRRKLDLNLWAYARTDTVRDGMAEKLKAAGFNWLAFGIESGSEAVRAGSDKALDEDEIRETIAKVRAAGIHVIGNFIFGLPGETRVTLQATLDLAQELNTEFANFYCAMAYPGSPLYAETMAKRPQDLPSTWAGYSQLGSEALPLRTEALPAKEILAFRDSAFRVYHQSVRYLDMIRETFGEAGEMEVRRMLEATIERSP